MHFCSEPLTIQTFHVCGVIITDELNRVFSVLSDIRCCL